MGLSFFAIRQGSLSFRLTAASIVLRDLGLVSLIVFFLWRNREPVERIGWTFVRGWRDAVLGAVLFALIFFGSSFLEEILKAAGFTAPATPLPQSLAAGDSTEFFIAGALVVVVAIAEEIIFRGYLVLRLQAVTGSGLAAAILSSIVFALGHGYEGNVGVVVVGWMGLVFALVYLWRKSLVAPMVMHFLQDFAGIVIVPLLKHRS